MRNMPHKLVTTILLNLFASDALGFGFENEECSNREYLMCIKSDPHNCVDANAKAKELCYEKYPIESLPDEANELDMANKFGKCVADEYLIQLDISSDDFEKCGIHLREIYAEKIKRAKEKLKMHDEEFHKYE